MLNDHDQLRLDELFESMQEANENFLGYPFARGFKYESLWRFLSLTGNNLGDPFEDGSYRVASRQFEREVVHFFAGLFNADPDDHWGYVTNGGTEGNIYGLYLARELFKNGVVYYSRDTHYSIPKAVHLLGLRYVVVKSSPNGEIDYEDLRKNALANADKPAIVVANIGTTMKEAKDDVSIIRSLLHETGITDIYVHCDAALCGPFAPFLEPKPAFDFSEGADSITISGHKFIGAPMPCGVVITRKSHVNRVTRSVEYIGALDTTLTGSRNAYTPLVLWYAIRSMGKAGIRKSMKECQDLAAYATRTMVDHGIAAWRNPGALTVVFPKVDGETRTKWQLATQDINHVIVMPGATRETIDEMVASVCARQGAGERTGALVSAGR